MGKAEKNSTGNPSYKEKESFLKHLSKKDRENLYFKNRSLNSSLSYTLSHFITKVHIEESDKDSWAPFSKDPFKNHRLYSSSKQIYFENKLSNQAQKKFLDFFQFLKRFFFVPGHYTVFSHNNFPMSIGSASSASSFAALTMAVYELAKERSPIKDKINTLQKRDLAQLSRVGSGSSCRSFFSPWCIWSDRDVSAFHPPWDQLLHQLIIVESQPKSISSSEAHQRVKTSPHFKNRIDRANTRMNSLLSALQMKNWKKGFKICYEEFMDLHSLFETARPPFRYKKTSSQKVLECINEYWKNKDDGPLITMDAGANVHLLYRPDQNEHREKIKNLLFNYTILSSEI